MVAAPEEEDVAALRRDLVAEGLDPTGIDLAWLAGIRKETEAKIAAYRSMAGFAAADPAFDPPETGPTGRGA